MDTPEKNSEATQLSPSIFRAYDIRGIVETQLHHDSVYAIGQALASLYPEVKKIAIGRDGRLSSPALAESLCAALRASGIEVLDIGQVPTPLLYYAAGKHCHGSGLMLTGSHNPPQYNGIKMMMAGHTLAGEDIQAIYRAACRGDKLTGDGAYQELDISADYVAEVCQSITIKKPLRLALDCGNGVAGPTALKLFQALGCELEGLYCDVDGSFPNHHPNPSELQNLTDLKGLMDKGGFDVGLAFDGDGDRLGVIDSAGEVIWADRQMMVYARAVLADNPGAAIVFDVKSSSHLARTIEQHGGRARMSRTGHSYIKAELKESGALLAGEMSGHIFFNDRWYGFDDALYCAARLLEIIANSEQSSHEIFAALPVTHSTPELTIAFAHEGEQHEFIQNFVAAADFPQASVSTLDGLRADFPDGWGLVRASNTTPCLVLRFEGDSREALERIKSAFDRQLLQLDPELKLPVIP